MQIRHILVATDFSDAAAATHAHAAALAAATGAQVTLLTVDEVAEHEHDLFSWMEDYLLEVARQRPRLLEDCAESLRRLGVSPSLEVREGDPAEAICAYVREQGVDLLLMGQRGLRSTKKLLLGRTVRRTVRRVEVPVLVVPLPSAPGSTAGLPSYQRLLAATDFSEASRLGLRAAAELAAVLGGQVEALHVLRVPAMAPYPGGVESWALALPEETKSHLRQRLVETVEQACGREGAQRCRCSVVTGFSVAEALVEAAGRLDADLITAPIRGRRRVREVLFGSTTETLLRLASRPVLVFPREFLDDAPVGGEEA